MSEIEFVQLHNHSSYSLLDGLASPTELVAEAKRLGYKHLALTDHGTCAGLLNFQRACRKEGIKPILGMEAYYCEDHKARDKDARIHHLVLIAKNAKGYSNLIKLSTLSYIEGFYKRINNVLEKK